MCIFKVMGKIAGIYKITSPSGRIYIGQSIDIEQRFRSYRSLHYKAQLKLYGSFVKHGVNSHVFEVIEKCEVSELNNRERHWQDFYNVLSKNGMNLKLTKSNDKNGYLSEDTKFKISKAHKGVKKSKDHIENMRLCRIGLPAYNKGIKMSEAQRAKLSLIHSGSKRKPLSESTKKKISDAQKGVPRKKHTEEHKRKISMLMKNNSNNASGSRNLILIDLNTGVFYNSIKDFCAINNENRNVLYNMLKGLKKVNKYNNLKII